MSSVSWAASGITYHGRIVKPDNQPLESATTRFRIQIKAPDAGNCVLWEEEQTRNMLGSSGVFSITIGDSTDTTINYTRVDTYGWAMERVFSNRTTFSALTGCAVGNNYVPNAADGRILEVSFKEAPTDPVWEAFPATKINLIPMALNSLQLEGYRADEFLKIDPYLNQTPITNAGVNTLLSLIAGTSNLYVKPADPLGGDLTGTIGAGTVVGLRGRALGAAVPAVGQVLKFDGTSWVPSADDTGGAPADASYAAKGVVQFDTSAAVSGITVAAGVASLPNTITAAGPIGAASTIPVITYDAKGRLTTVATATVDDVTKLPLAGGLMTGSINMGLQNITNATSIAATNFSGRNLILNDNDTNTATISSPINIAANYTLTLPTTAPTNGYVLSTDGAGQLSWIAAATGSVTSVSGTAPIISSGGATPAISLDTGLGANKVPQVGGTALGANGVVVANGTATALTSLNCAVNQVIKFDASGFAVCGADDSGAVNAFVQNGNAFGATGVLGTNDNFALNFETNNTNRMTIANDGRVGINTPSPTGANLVITDQTPFPTFIKMDNQHAGTDYHSALEFSFLGGRQAQMRAYIPGSGNGTAFTFVASDSVDNTMRERMRIDPAGNVGIGTNAPAYNLDVLNAIRTRGGVGVQAGAGNIFWTYSPSVNLMSLGGIGSNPASGPLNIMNTGNVGIGTTTPAFPLEIFSNSGYIQNTSDSGNASALILSNTSAGGANWQVGSSGNLNSTGAGNFFLYNGAHRFFINGSGNTGIGTTTPATKLDVSGAVRIGNDATACAAGLAGSLRYNASVVEFCNGSTWQAFGVSGAGLTSLNGQTANTQTFAVNTAGTAPAINSAANVHTLSIPLASDIGVTAGTISSTEYATFNSKLTSPLTTKGDLLSRDGATHVRLPVGTNGQILSANSATASGLEWVAAPTGDITSVVAGAGLITGGTTGDVTVDVAAGNGIVVAADSVAVDTGLGINKIPQVGGTALGANGVVVANGTGTALTSLNCLVNQVIKFDASGFATCAADDAGAANAFVNGGNAFGAIATLGTNDAFGLALETNNVPRIYVDNTGSVGVGLGASVGASKLTVAGDIATATSGSTRIYAGYGGGFTYISEGNPGFMGSYFGLDLISNSSIANGGTGPISLRAGGYSNTPGLTVLPGNPGNVGIGTTNPIIQLDVNNPTAGSFTVSGVRSNTALGGIVATSSTYATSPQFQDRIGLVADGTTPGFNAAGLDLRADASGADIRLYTSGADPTNERMRITSTGNVGIGTTAPGAMLQVGTAGTSLGTLRLTGNTSGFVQIQPSAAAGSWNMTLPVNDGNPGQVLSTDGSGVTSWINAATGSGDISNGGNTFGAAATIGTNDNFALNFETNNSPRMTITNAGNVGIGVTNPTEPFRMEANNPAFGQIAIFKTTGAGSSSVITAEGGSVGSGGLFLKGDTNNNPWQILAKGSGGTLGISNTNNVNAADLFTFTGAGRIGIGASNPGTNLEIGNTADTGILLNPTSGTINWQIGTEFNNAYLSIGRSGIDHMALFNVNGGIELQSRAGEAMTLNPSGGDVVLGMSTSNTQVRGPLIASGIATAPSLSAAGSGKIYFDSALNKFRVSQNGGAYVDLGVGAAGASDIDDLTDAVYDPVTSLNMFLGSNVAPSVTTGTNNFGAGTNVLQNLTQGSDNIAIGRLALRTTTTGSSNTAIGTQALDGISAASTDNVAIGTLALFTNNTAMGSRNTAVGSDAGKQAGGAADNVYVGTAAGINASGTTRVTALGSSAFSGGAGNDVIAIGMTAGSGASGSNNIFIGNYASFTNMGGATGGNNTLVGHGAAGTNVTKSGSDNASLGRSTLSAMTAASRNTVIGTSSGSTLTTGSDNILLGYDVETPAATTSEYLNIGNLIYGNLAAADRILDLNGTLNIRGIASPAVSPAGQGRIYYDSTANKFRASQNGGAYTDLIGTGGITGTGTQYSIPMWSDAGGTAIGNSLLSQNAAGTLLNFGGVQFMHKLGGANNTFIGDTAGDSVAAGGVNNTGVGENTLTAVSTGDANSAFGFDSMAALTTGLNNTAMGQNSMRANNGSKNVAIGKDAMNTSTSSDENVAIGGAAMESSSGFSNVAVGYNSMPTISNGGTNTALGYQAGLNINGASSGNIFVGSNAGPSSAGAISNQLYIHNATGTPTIFGDLTNRFVGIATTGATSALDVNGAITQRGMAAPAVSPAGQGRIYFDSTSNKFRASQNGAAYADLLTSMSGFNANQAIVANGAGVATSFSCPVGQVLGFDASGFAVCTTISIAGGFVNNGNTFAAAAVLGTNDNNSLAFETNNATRVLINADGTVDFGGGTSSPADYEFNSNPWFQTTGLVINQSTYAFINGTAAGDAEFIGHKIDVVSNRTGAQTGLVTGLDILMGHNGAAPGANLDEMISADFRSNVEAETVVNSYGVNISSGVATTGSITNNYGINIRNPADTSSGAITNNYGLYIENQTTGTTDYAIYSAGGTNYFGGNVGIGTTTPRKPLHVYDSDGIDPAMIVTNNGAGGSIGFGTTVGTNVNNSYGAAIDYINDYAGESNGASGSLAFRTSERTAVNTYSKLERMRITTDGKVGIGTASPVTRLHLAGNNSIAYPGTSGSGFRIASATYTDSTSSGAPGPIVAHSILTPTLAASSATTYSQAATLRIAGPPTAGTNVTISDNYALYILSGNNYFGGGLHSAGNLSAGTANTGYRFSVSDSQATTPVSIIDNTSTGTDSDGLIVQIGPNANPTNTNDFIQFTDGDGTVIGQIEGTGGAAVAYTTTSDRRLKDNIRSTRYTLEDLLKIQVKDYNYLESDVNMTGFIAQDLYTVFPEAVSKPTDESKDYWGVDYSKLTPLLVKAIQDLYKKIIGTDSEVQALKAKQVVQAREIASVKEENEKLKQQNLAIKAYLCAKDPKAAICK